MRAGESNSAPRMQLARRAPERFSVRGGARHKRRASKQKRLLIVVILVIVIVIVIVMIMIMILVIVIIIVILTKAVRRSKSRDASRTVFTVSSHNFRSRYFTWRASDPRTIAYLHLNMPFESPNLPGAGPIFPDRTFEPWP